MHYFSKKDVHQQSVKSLSANFGPRFLDVYFLDSMQFIKVAIKGENMEEYKHVADSNFKVSGITGQFSGTF